ncbi:MAG: DNA-binding response regulator [Actinomycetota bacterium]
MARPPPRILFVDDEPAVLDGLRRALDMRAGEWDMVFETSPMTALRLATERPFDVVVADLRMPRLGGLDLLERLAAAGSRAPCIVLTGTGDMGSALDAINRIGVFRFFTKPCSTELLVQGIRDALKAAGPAGDNPAMAALNRLPFATIALDGRHRCVFMNRSGAQMLAAAQVLRLDGGGTCRAVTSAGTAALHRAAEATRGDGDARVVGLSDHDGKRFSALIEAADEGAASAVLVFVREIDARSALPVEALCELFGLTPSEARLAQALASGLDIRQAADAGGITVSTARTYLKRLFQKTDVNRQAELIRVLTSAVAGF